MNKGTRKGLAWICFQTGYPYAILVILKLWRPGRLWIYRDLSASAPWVLGLKLWAITTRQPQHNLNLDMINSKFTLEPFKFTWIHCRGSCLVEAGVTARGQPCSGPAFLQQDAASSYSVHLLLFACGFLWGQCIKDTSLYTNLAPSELYEPSGVGDSHAVISDKNTRNMWHVCAFH